MLFNIIFNNFINTTSSKFLLPADDCETCVLPAEVAEYSMPFFFFDIRDSTLIADDVGCEFPNAHAARDAAIKVLPEVAQNHIGAGQGHKVSVLMRNEAGQDVFAASLTLHANWLIDTA